MVVRTFNILIRSPRVVTLKKERKGEKETLLPHVNIKKKKT
jgi:hypothetical protein